MPISYVEPEKIQAVQTYLQQEFPGGRVETFPLKREDWQGYTVNFEEVVEMRRVAVTFEYFHFHDANDISAQLRELGLAAQLRNVGRQPLLVTTEGIKEAYR